MKTTIEVIYEYGTLAYTDFGRKILKLIKDKEIAGPYLINDKPRTIDTLKTVLSREIVDWDLICTNGWSFDSASQLRRFNLGICNIEGEFESQKDFMNCTELFLTIGKVIQAIVYDSEYLYWQNQEQLDTYICAGKPVEGLKRYKDKFQKKVELVDISNNPGRRILRQGYVESVGCVMWFHEDFWKRVGRPKPEQMGVWESVGLDIQRVVIYERPFTTDQGVEGEIQRTWRKAIFGA